MAAALIESYKGPGGSVKPLELIELVPAKSGAYEIIVDDKLVYSKLSTGKHISDEAAIRLIRDAN